MSGYGVGRYSLETLLRDAREDYDSPENEERREGVPFALFAETFLEGYVEILVEDGEISGTAGDDLFAFVLATLRRVGVPYGPATATGVRCPECGVVVVEDVDADGERTSNRYAAHYLERHTAEGRRLAGREALDLAVAASSAGRVGRAKYEALRAAALFGIGEDYELEKASAEYLLAFLDTFLETRSG